MKDKNLAGILGLFLGSFGVHRFYLGQTGLGVAYLLFAATGIPLVLGIIDGLVFLSMDQDAFDLKYNKKYIRLEKMSEGSAVRRERPARSYENRPMDRTPQRSKAAQDNAGRAAEYKKMAIEKYKDYDFEEAIALFLNVLKFAPQDIASHFNLACAYSLTEQPGEAFRHIDQAVGLGFNDFDRIRTHDALAFLRIQPDFEAFQANGFRLLNRLDAPGEEADLLDKITNKELQDRLRKLSELKEKGLLTEDEYDSQRRKLTNQ
ncbi:MAG: NINE protein [Haliscomenobacter sp.]